MAASQIYLSIKSRTKIVYEGYVESVSSYDVNGPFDILPSHANFIAIINDIIIINKGAKNEQNFKINHGLMSIYQDKADIYLDI